MSLRTAPCGWEPNAPCASGPCCPDLSDTGPNAEIAARARALAASVIWRLTGMQFGCCEITVRPCKPSTCDPATLDDLIYWDSSMASRGAGKLGVLDYFPTLIDGQVYNVACGCPVGCCKCKADCEILLPGPICEIKNVEINGETLGWSQFWLNNQQRLVFANRGQVVVESWTSGVPTPWVQQDAGPTAAGGNGLELSDVGNNYQFSTFPACNQDLYFDVFLPIGSSHEFDVFQPQGFTAEVIQGGRPGAPVSLTVDGSTVTVGTATVPGVSPIVRIKAPRGTCVSDIAIQQVSGTPIAIRRSQHTDATTGDGFCPPCQNYNLPLGEEGTWSVTYTIGVPVPDELNFAAGLYACELGKALTGDKSCSLSDAVQSVVRPGVNLAFLDPIVIVNERLTGIKIVDQIIRAVNPHKITQAPAIWTPGLAKRWRRETY